MPSVDRVLGDPRVERLVGLYGRGPVRAQVRVHISALRKVAAEGGGADLDARLEGLPSAVAAELEQRLGQNLRRVLNATGIFLHTNLGRAPLPPSVARELPGLADAYCDLEIDLGTGKRTQRNRRVEYLLTALTDAPAALVTNNNAAALLLGLAATAAGREVIVSRGELVEIGGSFRIPDVVAAAGVELVEVGTTNKTRIEDYAAAVGSRTAALLKVHPSNYRIRGFTSSVDEDELVALGREHDVTVIVDEGSGLLRPNAADVLRDHRSLSELAATGADLVCGSGDKVLGGPQAGVLIGTIESIDRCRSHPMYRAVRPGRLPLAALEAVLRLHLAGETLPIDRLLGENQELSERLDRVAAAVGAEIVEVDAFIGGGSAPDRAIPGSALSLPGGEPLFRFLRAGEPAVVGYVRQDRLVLDLRTVDPIDDDAVIEAVRKAVAAI